MLDLPVSETWYQDWFDDDYLALYWNHGEAEANRFVSTIWSKLGLKPGVRVADLPCGPGRYSRAFAERGAEVTGLDLSEVMLERAREAFIGLEPVPELIHGDLRNLPFESQFDLVVNLFTSFGYFRNEADNARVFAELSRVLRPGGRLIIDVVNPNWLKANFSFDDIIETPELTAETHKELVDNGRRVIKTIRLKRDNHTRTITEAVRLYTHDEMTAFAEANNLTVAAFWADYDGNPWTEDSPRLILLARK